MCGRFHRFDDVQKMATQFRAKYDESLFAPPTYNAPPQTWQPVIRLDQDGEREIVNMRWGLVPYWSKDDKTAFSTFNARAETILSSNTFRNAMRKRRCLVPVNGFYEWQKREKGVKQPYAIGMKDGSSFAFAGLWEAWIETPPVIERRLDLAAERVRRLEERRRLEEMGGALFPLTPEEREGKVDPDADPTPRTLLTFTIITCDPNELTQEFHDRMPVILDPKDYDRWLEPGDPQQPPIDLLRPYPAELMRAWKIGPDVGNVRNNRPGLIDPIE